MKQKKNNLVLSLTVITAIMTLLWTSSKVHSLLAKASSISTIEFYIICIIMGVLVCIMVIINDHKKERQEDGKMLYEKITSEYKKYVSSEAKFIKLKITEVSNQVDSMKTSLSNTLEKMENMTSKTNGRIDELLNNLANK